MDYEPEEFDRLSKRLSAAAVVSRAKAYHHALKGEHSHEKLELKRAQDAERAAELNAFAFQHFKGLKSKAATQAKRAGFVPPTFEEVLEYARKDEACRGWPEKNIRTWFDHFVSVKWMVGGKSRMADWQAAARNGARRWFDEHGSPGKAAPAQAEPEGWLEFVAARGVKPDPRGFRYCPEWMKTDFRDWKKMKRG